MPRLPILIAALIAAMLAVPILAGPRPAQAAGRAAPAPVCDYDVVLSGPDARALEVSADCRTDAPLELRPRTPLLRRYLQDLTVGGTAASNLDLFDWMVPASGGHARFTYRYDLDAAAAADGSMDGARRFGRSVVAPVRTWLLGPGDPAAVLRLHFGTPHGGHILTGLRQAQPGGPFALGADDLDYGGYALLGTFRAYGFKLPAAPEAPGRGPAAFTLGLPDPAFALPDRELLAWVERSANVVAAYWGGFPSRRTLFILAPEPMAGGVIFGRVRGGGGTTGFISLGELTERDQLYGSWELVHEMMHLGNPFLPDGFWFMEGFATYAEPLARARAGWRSVKSVWEEFLRSMPRGVAAMTGGGIGARNIDTMYWGGALFMLLADVAIRVQTDNRMGLEDCVGAVLRDGGDASSRWTLAKALHSCDAATGGRAVARLVQRQVEEGRPLDLQALWRDLGVRQGEHGVILDDNAPLAAVRRAITGGRRQGPAPGPAAGPAAPVPDRQGPDRGEPDRRKPDRTNDG